jgi:ADP-heptose:LPS heptosyltransferase
LNLRHQSAPLCARQPSRLLVVAAGHVGNNVFCTPAIQLLRSALPATVIDVVALNAASASVFAANDTISSLHVVRWPWQMARLAARYDEVICLHPKSAPLLARVSVPVTVIPPFGAKRHHAEQILAFASSLVGRPVDDSDRRYHLAAAASQHLAVAGGLRIGIHLGCGRTAIQGWKFFYGKRGQHPKLWPTEYYVALAEKLRQRFPDVVFVITGTRNERFLARRFARAMSGIVDLTGKTSTVELAGVIGELDLFITHDCGVLHVAATTPTPLLALFGPTHPEHTGPWPPASHRLILQGASMAAITPEMAASAAVELLQRRQSQ